MTNKIRAALLAATLLAAPAIFANNEIPRMATVDMQTLAKLENISYVFDRSGLSTSQLPILIYTQDATDLTQNILKKLNKEAPPVSKTAAAP